MLWADFVNSLTILAQQHDALGTYTFLHNPDFTTYLPRVVEYSEQRIYREMVPLYTRAQQSSSTAKTTAGARTIPFTLFASTPVVLEGLAVITPVAAGSPGAGRRWQYQKVSLDFIDSVWPVEATTMAPNIAYPELYWAMLDALNIVVAPTPDAAYPIEGTGIFRPVPFSATSNFQGTVGASYLSIYYPDLLCAAAMIAVAGLMRDYGAQSDDPKLAVSWEGIFSKAITSAMEEEQRRRGLGFGGESQPPAPEASSPRGIMSVGGGVPTAPPARGGRVPY